MKKINKKLRLTLATIMLLFGLGIISCQQNQQNDNNIDNNAEKNASPEIIIKDYGAEPTVLNIETYTESNNNFRTALWTGSKLQITLMSISIGGEVGLEQHLETDQFLRIESGKAKVLMGDNKESLTFDKIVDENFAIIVPAGKWHNIINIGDEPLKLYSIYSPVEHPHSTIHKTFKESEEAEHH